jgi:hypothetical protein
VDEPLPNKCDYCGLCVSYAFGSASATHSDDADFTALHKLKSKGVLKSVPARLVGASNLPGDFGSTAFCAVESKAWQKRDKRCGHWRLRIKGASIGDYLSLHHDERNARISLWVGIVAIVIGVLVAVAQAI